MKFRIESPRIYIILVAVFVLLVFLHYVRVITPVENLIINGLKPLQEPVYSFSSSIRDFFTRSSSEDDLRDENERLKTEISKLQVENTRLKSQLSDSQILAQQLAFVEKFDYQSISAKVLSRNSESVIKILILNKGKKDGVKKNSPVIVEDGFLVGRIIEVGEVSSKLLLINDTQSIFGAEIQNETSSTGTVKGTHGISLELDLVTQEEDIREGQSVITSGVEGDVPNGLLIGSIEKVMKEPGELFQKAVITTPIDLNQIKITTIIIIN